MQTENAMDSPRFRKRAPVYQPGSVLEHLLYGLGTTAVLIGPAFLPGLDARQWVVGFFGAVMIVYLALCVLGAWKSVRR